VRRLTLALAALVVVRATDVDVRIITTRFGLIRQVPTAAELARNRALTQSRLIDLLRLSTRYAGRFNG